MPTIVCPQCASQAFEWRVCEGAGTVYSFTVVHRAPSDAFSAHTPFVVALIDLKEGPRVMTNIIGDDRFEVAIGDSVRVCFEPREEATVPQFRRQATAP